jgi:hypothetical protein
MLHLADDMVEGLTGLLCLTVEPHPAPPAPSGLTAEGG